MCEWRINGITIRLCLLFFASLTAALIFDKTGIVALCMIASLLHECGHLTALFLLKIKPLCISLDVFGMRLSLPSDITYTYRRQIIVCLCGPLANALCALVLWCAGDRGVFPMIHLALAGFQLLPIVPLDGGQTVRAALMLHLQEKQAGNISFFLSLCFLIPLLLAGFFVFFHDTRRFSLLFFALYAALMLFFDGKD